jgi:hypothetical protein
MVRGTRTEVGLTFNRNMLLAGLLFLLIQPIGITWFSDASPTTTEISVQAETAYDFSFVWMSDTQYYSAQYPSVYDNMTQWIANNKDEMNIEYVIHTGDIINTAADDSQWQHANHSMRILDDANMHYGVLAGNHEGQDNFVNYYKYFGAQRFQDEDCYHDGGGGNHYDLITSHGVGFVIVYLSYGINSSERAWASNVFQTYSGRIGILAVHEYISASGSYSGDGFALSSDVVAPNDNVLLVLCGHIRGGGLNVKTAGSRTYYEMLSDYQGLMNGGNGYQKILYFDAIHDEVHVRTYSTVLNQYGGSGYGYDEFDMTLPLTPTTYTVTFNTDPTDGSVTADGVAKSNGATETYYQDQRVHVVANPPSGYTFSHWEANSVSVDNTFSADTYMTVSENGWLKVQFVMPLPISDVASSIVSAGENEVYFLYPDYHGAKPPGVAPALLSDWTATGFMAGMCTHLQYEATDTNPSVVDSGSGALTLQGKTFILFGGPLVNAPVHYYETNRIAPLYYQNDGGTLYWYRTNGTRIDATALLGSQKSSHDMFVVESFTDDHDNRILIVYGYGWKGTFAGGKFFKFVMYPNIASYTASYYVFQWIDNNGDGFVNLNEISTTPIAQG